MQKGILIIISGPSGVGKTTIAKAITSLCQQYFPLRRIITYTTRTARVSEIDGVDYHFISHEEFKNKIKNNFFFEHTNFNSNYYGTPNIFHSLTNVGISCLVVTDLTVAQKVKAEFNEALLFWITPPSMKALGERLLLRNTESLEKIKERLLIAQKELQLEHKSRSFDYHIINTDINNATHEILTIIKSKKSF